MLLDHKQKSHHRAQRYKYRQMYTHCVLDAMGSHHLWDNEQ